MPLEEDDDTIVGDALRALKWSSDEMRTVWLALIAGCLAAARRRFAGWIS